MDYTSFRRRRKSSAPERADWLARLTASGLGVTEFARQHRLPPATLAQWKWKAARSTAPQRSKTTASPSFHTIEVPVVEADHRWDVEVILPNGLRCHIRQGCPVRWLQELLQSLA